jgi:hypothetical protein
VLHWPHSQTLEEPTVEWQRINEFAHFTMRVAWHNYGLELSSKLVTGKISVLSASHFQTSFKTFIPYRPIFWPNDPFQVSPLWLENKKILRSEKTSLVKVNKT